MIATYGSLTRSGNANVQPDRDITAQAAPDYEVDQRTNW